MEASRNEQDAYNVLLSNTFQSPLVGQLVTNVTGLVMVRTMPWSPHPTTCVLGKLLDRFLVIGNLTLGPFSRWRCIRLHHCQSGASQVAPGDIVTLSAKVAEYRSNVDYLFLMELTAPANITMLSSRNASTPIVLEAHGPHPPTQRFISLEVCGPLTVPGNASRLAVADPTRNPSLYGLDFWESLSGKFVKVTKPTAINYPVNLKIYRSVELGQSPI